MTVAERPLGYVGSSTEVRTQEHKGVSTVTSSESHRGHRCCVDPSQPGGARFSLIGSRPVLQGAVPTAAGRTAGIGRPTAAVVVAARCGSYGCRCCATRNIRRNRKRAALGVAEGGVVALLTATLDPSHSGYRGYLDSVPQLRIAGRATKVRGFESGVESAASVRFVSRAWNRWVTRVRRIEPRWVCECRRVTAAAGGRPSRPAARHERGCTVRYRPFSGLAFFKGMELQRNGNAHIHVLVRVADLEALFVAQGVLRAEADRAGFGGRRRWRDGRGRLRSGFEIERVRSAADVTAYVTKAAGSAFSLPAIAGEVAKGGQQRTLPPYTRRASWSMGARAWTTRWADVRRRDLDWSFARWDPAGVTRVLEASGVKVGRHLFPAEGSQEWLQQATA